jgi:hypothetical protein
VIELKLHLFAACIGLGLFTFVVYLVRNEHLSLRYALLWLITSLIFLILALFPPIVKVLSEILGIKAPSNALFLLGIIFIISLLLMLTIGFSHLAERQRELTQRYAILQRELEVLAGEKDIGKGE